MMLLRFAGALVVMALAGLGIAAWLQPRRTANVAEMIGRSILFGSVAVSVLLGIASLVLRGNALIGTVALASACVAASGWRRLRRIEWSSGGATHGICLAVAVALVGWQSLVLPLGSDGLFNFEIRADLGWRAGGGIPAAFFSDTSRVGMHPAYPLFVPLNELWLYLCLGGPHQTMVKLLGTLWFAGVACAMCGALARMTKSPARGLLGVGLLLAVPSIVLAPGGAAWTWGDFPLGAFALLAALALVDGDDERSMALAIATLPWVKRDGLIVGAVLLLVCAVQAVRRGTWRALLCAAIPFAAVAGGWKVFTVCMHTPPMSDFAVLSKEHPAPHLERTPSLVAILLRELLVWQRWGLLWPVALLACLRIGRAPELVRWRGIAAAVVALLAIYGGLYVFSTWPVVVWHVLTSLPRLLIPAAMLAIPLVVAAIPGKAASEDGDESGLQRP